MTNKELIQKFYLEDGIRNVELLKTFLQDDIVLEWSSSDGLLLLQKEAILKIAEELQQNYNSSHIEITHLIEEGNEVVVKYNQKVTTIENPKELMFIARFIVIWEFKDGKLIKGYQISQPA
ncbi:MAG: nuclear transport factor 2 family protein [Flavobacterium sp.]|nr:nuclear transport factor 2 family protein [Flavobacterium sp.]